MFETVPKVGRHCVSVCTNVSCMIVAPTKDRPPHREKVLGIETGESTSDGRIFLKKEEECLAPAPARR